MNVTSVPLKVCLLVKEGLSKWQQANHYRSGTVLTDSALTTIRMPCYIRRIRSQSPLWAHPMLTQYFCGIKAQQQELGQPASAVEPQLRF